MLIYRFYAAFYVFNDCQIAKFCLQQPLQVLQYFFVGMSNAFSQNLKDFKGEMHRS